MNLRYRLERAQLASFNPVRQTRGAVGMIHRRLRARREASTIEANCSGSTMGRPRRADMLVRSTSAETMRKGFNYRGKHTAGVGQGVR
jgi:hypothetical protein